MTTLGITKLELASLIGVSSVSINQLLPGEADFVDYTQCVDALKHYLFCSDNKSKRLELVTELLLDLGLKAMLNERSPEAIQLSQLMQVKAEQVHLDSILANYSQPYLVADNRQFTIQVWLEAKGVELSHAELTRFSVAVNKAYVAHEGKPAPRIAGNKLGNRGFGKVSVFTTKDIPIIESAFEASVYLLHSPKNSERLLSALERSKARTTKSV